MKGALNKRPFSCGKPHVDVIAPHKSREMRKARPKLSANASNINA